MHACNLLVLCINAPLHYALYDDDRLLESFSIDEKPSTALPLMYQRLRESSVCVRGIYYASGPGNLSALKLTHTFLHSWAIVESIPLYATHSFALLPEHYIYAFGKKHFIMRENIAPSPTKSPEQNLALITANIECVLCENPPHSPPFTPPAVLPKSSFCLPCEPIYILPPV